MFVKCYVRSLFLSPQSGVGSSISSSVVQCSVFLPVCISVPVLTVYFCPSSVRVVATFSGTVSFPLLCSVLPFFSFIHWLFSLSNYDIPSKRRKNFICAASKRCSYLFFSTQASLPHFNAALAVMLWILNFVFLFICFPKCLHIAPFILLYVCNLSSKSLLYSAIRYPNYLKSVICSIILSWSKFPNKCLTIPPLHSLPLYPIHQTQSAVNTQSP